MSSKHPNWCDDCFCYSCDSASSEDCFKMHEKGVVHRWLMTSTAFDLVPKIDGNHVWIQQGFKDKKPTAWCAYGSFDPQDGTELSSEEFLLLAEVFKKASKVIN